MHSRDIVILADYHGVRPQDYMKMLEKQKREDKEHEWKEYWEKFKKGEI